ncbi:MAG: SDR family NAD(P)-dependent oxidoreductase [Promethearchaeota archaeon]
MLEKNLLSGKKTCIIGGSYGIGRSLAIGFAELGAEVGIISRSKDKLEEVVITIGDKGFKAIYEIGDASDYNQLKQAIDSLRSRMEGVDILINNAGVSRIKPYHELKPHQIDLLADINFKGTMYGTHIILPYFLEKNKGSIINTSSIGGLGIYPTNIVYGATKAAVNYFTRALVEEYRGKQITFNAILPGPVETPMYHFGLTNEEVQAVNPIQPEELVAYYAFFTIKKNETGKLINIESFRHTFREIYKIEDFQSKKFDEIVSVLENKLPNVLFKEVMAHKPLLQFLLKSKTHYYQ